MGERLSDERLAVLMSHAENFGELLIGPSNLAALVAECQEFRSPLVRARLEYGDAIWAVVTLRTSGIVPSRETASDVRAAVARVDRAVAGLRAALANTKEREG